MKKKGIACACAASLLICNCITATSVSAIDYSFIQKAEPLQYDVEFQQELDAEDNIQAGKPDTSWFDSEDQRTEYEITTEEQLLGLAKLVNTRKLDWQVNEVYTFKGITLKLMNDIELTQNWTPIGSSDTHVFEGFFDGNGHTVSGVTIKGSTNNNQGFFGYLNGTVNNLNLEGSIETTGSSAGGITAAMAENAVVENCTVNMAVCGKNKVGGIVGENLSGLIINCHNLGNVMGYVKIGGIVGENWDGTVEQCSNEGIIVSEGKGVGTYGTGGIAGRSVAKDALIKECYNRGNIHSSNECAGGIVGYTSAQGSTIKSCYNVGSISGPKNTSAPYGYVGGIVGSIGEHGVVLADSYSAGAVKNGKYAGGILGNYTADFYSKIETYVSNNYYLDGSAPAAVGKEKENKGRHSYSDTARSKSSGDMRSAHMASSLSPAFRPDTGGMNGINNGFPVFIWQKATQVDKDILLNKMKIGYKKEFKKFFKNHPNGTDSGNFIVELSNPQSFFEDILSDMNNINEKE